MDHSELSEIDAHVQNNEEGVSYIQTFLTQKQMELSELQNFLLQEFKDMEIWKDQRDRLVAIFNTQIKRLLSEFKNAVNSLKISYENVVTLTLKDTAAMFAQVLQAKQDIITSQQQQINRLRESAHHQVLRTQYSYQQPKRQTSQKNLLSRSTFLENQYNRSKSKENISRSPQFNQKKQPRKSPSTTKQIMREVQRSLKEGHQNMRVSCHDHKKYVKDKIQQLKTRNSGIFYENYGRKF